MYERFGWWFPDYDTHFAEMLAKNVNKGNGAVYQKPQRDVSIKWTPQRRVALDIGANVGLWSRDLAQIFDQVIAFEPIEEFRQCFQKNVDMSRVVLCEYALGNQDTMIDMIVTQGNTGHSHVDLESIGQGHIEMRRLDSVEFECIDYIKIDCEGFELQILQGARETLLKHQPIVVIEQKLHQEMGLTDANKLEARDFLLSLGAMQLAQVGSEHVMGWNKSGR